MDLRGRLFLSIEFLWASNQLPNLAVLFIFPTISIGWVKSVKRFAVC